MNQPGRPFRFKVWKEKENTMNSHRENTIKLNPEPAAPKDSQAGTGISIGVGVGMSIGVALGLLTKNLALGIAIGVALGAGVGAALEETEKRRSRTRDDHS